MRETVTQFNEALTDSQNRYPADPLRIYSFHTGGPLRPLEPEEPCPVLFRDIGPQAMADFLDGNLKRLAGPLSPITYMRTEAYQEPYTDYARIGRLVILRPLELQIWHSGLASIYVSRATRMPITDSVGYIPGHLTLTEARPLMEDVQDVQTLREVLGGKEYDDVLRESRHQLDLLEVELQQSEQLAAPLRKLLQSPQSADRERAWELMQSARIDEQDLCAAWHHLPCDRRIFLLESLGVLSSQLQCHT